MSKLDDLLKPKAPTRNYPPLVEGSTIPRRKQQKSEYYEASVDERENREPAIEQTAPPQKPTDDTEFTEQEKQVIMDEYLKRHKHIRKRERNMLLDRESDGLKASQWFIIILAMVGIGFLFMLYQFTNLEWVMPLIILLGSFMFLPAGMIIGWATLDPYMRCKILRRISKRNYGIVNFVGKGNKMVSKIKNFDDALVWKKNKVWVITKEHIYQLTKQGDSIVDKHEIEPDNIISLIETVPVMFVDLDSMQPLSLAKEGREAINPEELGATLKSWADNQLAKAMMLKKTFDMYFIIIIICVIASAGLCYINMTRIDELTALVKTMQGQITTLMNATGV